MNNLKQKLAELGKELKEKYPDFPNESCIRASQIIYNRFDFLPVAGFVSTKSYDFRAHAWNIYENLIIDLTLYQFNYLFKKSISEVIVIPSRRATRIFHYAINPRLTESLRREISLCGEKEIDPLKVAFNAGYILE